MKKLLIIIVILSLITIIGMANLSDETKELVNDLRWKQSGELISCVDFADIPTEWSYVYEWTNITFDDGILYIETKDGKWFIQMEKIED